MEEDKEIGTAVGGEGDDTSALGASLGGDDELSLPKATVAKLVQEMLPPGISCPKETRSLLIDCCVEFIHLVSSEANDVCEKGNRKTISPEHVIEALRQLGFEGYITDVQQAYDTVQTQAKEKERIRGANKLEMSGLTEEQLQRQQEELFEQARRKYLESRTTSGGDAGTTSGSSMTSGGDADCDGDRPKYRAGSNDQDMKEMTAVSPKEDTPQKTTTLPPSEP